MARDSDLTFDSMRSVTAPMTWAQQEWWGAYRAGTAYVTVTAPVSSEGITVDDVRRALRELVGQHETLRTRYPCGPDGSRRQVVLGEGSIPVHRREETGAQVDPLVTELTATPFDHEQELPLRAGLLFVDNRLSVVVLVVSAYAVDCWSVPALEQDLALALAGKQAPPTPQPVELAAFEQSADGAALAAESLRYWRQELAQMPNTSFPVAPADQHEIRHQVCAFESRAVAAACTTLAVRYRVSTGHVLLAGLASVIGRWSGTDACLLGIIVNNRLADPGHAGRALLHMREAPCGLALGDASFRELARTCRGKVMAGFRHARSSPAGRTAMRAEMARTRGFAPTPACLVNDTRQPATFDSDPAAGAAQVRSWLAASTLEWSAYTSGAPEVDLLVTVLNRTDTAAMAVLVDTYGIAVADAELILQGVETLLVEALDRDVWLSEIGELTGVEPPPEVAGWTLVDHSWVDPRRVARAMTTVTGSATAVFAEETSDGRTLTAFVAGSRDGDPDLPRLHGAVVDELRGARDAIAPHRYVVCASAPADVESLAGWRGQPVLATGTGRE